ncbi:MAG: SRPBCC family protein [Gemmataceae bacterium]
MGVLGWSMTVLGLIAGLLSVMTIFGLFIPRDHVASRELTLHQHADEVWRVLRDAPNWPSWWKILQKVEPLPDRDGKPAHQLHFADGRNKFDLVVRSAREPAELVTEIDDARKMFQGTWTYVLTPSKDGCTVRLTENGSVPNPLIRVMARLMMNQAMYIESNLTALAVHFGEESVLRP